MKLNPSDSKRIHRLFIKLGVGKGTLILTLSSILISLLITFLISACFGNDPGILGYSIAIIAPTIIASIASYFYLSVYLELEQSRQEIDALAHTDDLTKIYNRRYFFKLAEREIQRSLRNDHSLSVILFDIDNFKTINDRHGHMVGDFVLKKLCQVSQSIIRQYDIFARFGGEEFIILLPEANKARARKFAERLRQLIAEYTFSQNGIRIQVTISVGLAALHDKTDSLDNVISRADKALYQAKELGKNRTVVM